MNATKKLISITALAIAATASLLGAANAQTLRLAHHHAVGGAVDQAANYFADLVSEKSDGRITIRVFPGAQLGQEREAYDLVNQGGIDISITSPALIENIYPEIGVTSAPFMFRDWDHARGLYNGEFGQKIAEGVRANSDTQVLGYFHLGFRDLLFTGDAPTTLAELSGRRMRSPENFVWIRMFELLGTSPTPVTWGEVYSAMQTGIAEGLDSPAATALDMNFQEVTSSLLKSNHMFGSMFFAMNAPRFEGFSEDDQALLLDAAVEAGNWSDLEVAIPDEVSAYTRFEELGITVVEPDDPEEFRQAMAPLLEEIGERSEEAAYLLELIAAE